MTIWAGLRGPGGLREARPQPDYSGTRLILVEHNLDRASNRVTKIGERRIFVIAGKVKELGLRGVDALMGID
jgi:hypothetical protein